MSNIVHTISVTRLEMKAMKHFKSEWLDKNGTWDEVFSPRHIQSHDNGLERQNL